MNTKQLDWVMKSDRFAKLQFRGVYAADQLPVKVREFPSAYIANTDPTSKPGTHWVAFYFADEVHGEFFDSYGMSPDFYNEKFEQFVKTNSSTWTFNDKKLQSLDSQVCGQYCLYYLLLRCRGITKSKIIEQFSDNVKRNDRYVVAFICKHFNNVLKMKTCNPKQSCKALLH